MILPWSSFESIKAKAKELMETDGFKRGLNLAMSGINTAEAALSPATPILRDYASQFLDSNTGKELVKTLDAIPPNMGGGWEDDAARVGGQYLKAMKAAAPDAGYLLGAVPAFLKRKRAISMASDPKFLEAVTRPLPPPVVPFTRYQTSPILNPNNRRGGSYVYSYPGAVNNPQALAEQKGYVGGQYHVPEGYPNPQEGGTNLVEGLEGTQRPLSPGRSVYSFFGNNALNVVAPENSNKITTARGVAQKLSKGDQSFLPKNMRLNNVDLRKIGQHPNHPDKLGASGDAVGDYLLSKYAKFYGYGSVQPRPTGNHPIEKMILAPGRHDPPLPVTYSWDTLRKAIGAEHPTTTATPLPKTAAPPVLPWEGNYAKKADPAYMQQPIHDADGNEINAVIGGNWGPPDQSVTLPPQGEFAAKLKALGINKDPHDIGYDPYHMKTGPENKLYMSKGDLVISKKGSATPAYDHVNHPQLNDQKIANFPLVKPLGSGMYHTGQIPTNYKEALNQPYAITVIPGHSAKVWETPFPGNSAPFMKLSKPKDAASDMDYFLGKAIANPNDYPKSFAETLKLTLDKMAKRAGERLDQIKVIP